MKALLILALCFLSEMAFSYVLDSGSDFDVDHVESTIRNKKSLEISELIQFLPPEIRLNFVLKHGIKRKGERGHLVEEKVSQSADPHLPRAILWNESNGFSLSYNGGSSEQKANQRLDILTFSKELKTFDLRAIDFPLTLERINSNVNLSQSQTSCRECHGPHNRPIFSMYPDWPAFYGSDNDEINNSKIETQNLELKDYQDFKKNSAVSSGRYSPLYDTLLVERTYGFPLWETYPYRQDTSTVSDNISRAFAFRPGLRLGILYNRLNAEFVFNQLKKSPFFDKYSVLTLNTLLQCNGNLADQKQRLNIEKEIKLDLNRTISWVGKMGIQLSYHDLWNLYDLSINDVDIRYSYNNEAYKNKDASTKIMQTGYIGRYFNSYFDGTATIDELVIAKLLTNLEMKYPSLKNNYHLRGLVEKYERFKNRFKYDKANFENFDRLGLWFAIPYPKQISAKHHRESYTQEMLSDYINICKVTETLLRKQFAQ